MILIMSSLLRGGRLIDANTSPLAGRFTGGFLFKHVDYRREGREETVSLMFSVCRSAIDRTKDASNPYQISFQVAGSEVSGHVHHFLPVCCVCDSECLCMSIPNEVTASCVADIGQLTLLCSCHFFVEEYTSEYVRFLLALIQW